MLRNQSQAAKVNARVKRKGMSLPEVLLWKAIKGNAIGFRVRRQHPLGIYTMDFFLPEVLMCIEVDGASHEFREKPDYDRDRAMDALGIQTVRFPASAVLRSASEVARVIHIMACEKIGRQPFLE